MCQNFVFVASFFLFYGSFVCLQYLTLPILLYDMNLQAYVHRQYFILFLLFYFYILFFVYSGEKAQIISSCSLELSVCWNLKQVIWRTISILVLEKNPPLYFVLNMISPNCPNSGDGNVGLSHDISHSVEELLTWTELQ